MNKIPTGKDRKITPKVALVKRREYRVIRVNGEEELIHRKPFVKVVEVVIGATFLDTVILDFENSQVMFIDDTGMIEGKPINPKATALYRSICKTGSAHSIHGDVVIANDEDFG